MTDDPFAISGHVAAITGGAGVLGGALSLGLARAGVRVAVLDRRQEGAEAQVERIRGAGGEGLALAADVFEQDQIAAARDEILRVWKRSDDRSIFDVPIDAFDEVVRLNLHGSVIPALGFGAAMARQGAGCIVNISSMAATQAMSGVMGYSAAKAGIDNFTRWLAVELARKFGDRLRVNAIAPGFFVTTQNRDVLINADGSYTERARAVIARTPMGRFGSPDDLVGTVRWLVSDAARFVTGVVIPVDGGFSAYSGI
jgi:NAD(P)-dependent dehydrogenase (short-subunit alcohol dehydrogenase family)